MQTRKSEVDYQLLTVTLPKATLYSGAGPFTLSGGKGLLLSFPLCVSPAKCMWLSGSPSQSRTPDASNQETLVMFVQAVSTSYSPLASRWVE